MLQWSWGGHRTPHRSQFSASTTRVPGDQIHGSWIGGKRRHPPAVLLAPYLTFSGACKRLSIAAHSLHSHQQATGAPIYHIWTVLPAVWF